MPEVIFPGPEGRLEGRYHPQKDRDAPIAIILHPHPQFGGTIKSLGPSCVHHSFAMGTTMFTTPLPATLEPWPFGARTRWGSTLNRSPVAVVCVPVWFSLTLVRP